MAVIIIGLMGRIGSGKGTVARVLKRDYDFKVITMGDLAREEVRQRGLEPSREVTTRVTSELLSKDPAYYVKKAVKRIKSSGHERWVIDGIRTPLNVTEFRKAFPSIKFIKVDVKPRTRFERMKNRGRPGFPETFSNFQEHERLEDERFNLDKTLSMADYVLDNNGTISELEARTHELMKSILND